MVKLIIFFRQPADVDAFEEHFANRHVPLIGAMPNVVRSAVTRAIGAPRGEPPYYLIHDVYFADLPALTFALNSAPGRAAGADLMTFARDVVTLMYAEVWGEDPFELGLGAGSEPAPEVVEATAAVPAAATAAGAPDLEAKPGLTPIDISFLENPPAPAGAAAEAAPAPEAEPEPAAEAAPAPEAEPEPAAEAAPAAEAGPETAAPSAMAEAEASTSTSEDGVTPSDTQDPAAPRPPRPSLGETRE